MANVPFIGILTTIVAVSYNLATEAMRSRKTMYFGGSSAVAAFGYGVNQFCQTGNATDAVAKTSEMASYILDQGVELGGNAVATTVNVTMNRVVMPLAKKALIPVVSATTDLAVSSTREIVDIVVERVKEELPSVPTSVEIHNRIWGQAPQGTVGLVEKIVAWGKTIEIPEISNQNLAISATVIAVSLAVLAYGIFRNKNNSKKNEHYDIEID